MYDSVIKAFNDFNTPIEGKVNYMYCDVKGLVTVGIGNMLPDADSAALLNFRWKDTNKKATAAEIRSEWSRIKGIGNAARYGYYSYEKLTKLTLPDVEVYKLCSQKLYENEAIFIRKFPDFAKWPADAQMAAMSMCWSLGPYFPNSWPKITKALKEQDFIAAALECKISEVGNPGVAPRNVANKAYFQTAAKVVSIKAVRSTLWYPKTPVAPVIKQVVSASNVKYGKTNADIKKVQNALIKNGSNIAAGATGYYGSQTRDAVKKYQTKKKLYVDGIAGPVTLKSLGFIVK